MAEAGDIIQRHVKDIAWLRKELLGMDGLCKPIMGIGDWDDAAIIEFGKKKLVASIDGPYTKRLVMKSALVHAATDVAVKGARPLLALDALIGPKKDVSDMVSSLRRQANALSLPILGGNTRLEDVEPACSIAIAGELLLGEPIRDCGAREGDVIALLGEPIWGSQKERMEKAIRLFKTWFKILGGKIKINSAKDVTKGGLICAVYEMEQKSGLKFSLDESLPYPMARNLDNFIISTTEVDYAKIKRICEKNKCPLVEIGRVS